MFRIKENPDGSVSIFSNDENQEFICAIAARTPAKSFPKKIPEVPVKVDSIRTEKGKTSPVKAVPVKTVKKKKENVPTSPTRLTLSPRRSKRKSRFSGKDRPVWPPNKPNRNGYSHDEDDTSSVSSFETASSTFSFASTISIESSAEPDEDCLDQVNFCRMLELVESKRLRGTKEEYQELQRSFPIRKIACQVRWQDQKRRFQKLSDCIGFSSLLSRNVLSQSQNHVLQASDRLRFKYEKFCNNSVNPVQPVVSSAPLLRTRENKARFPVTFKKLNGYIHEYTFNKKQRKRRADHLRLGLSRRSYLLKSKCRKSFVLLQRLSKETIDRYCNPPSKKVQDVHCPIKEFKSQETTLEVSNVKLPNGTSHMEPVVCLGPENYVTHLLRKFGTVQV